MILSLGDDLKEQLPAILNWALHGAKMLKENGRFTIPEASRAALNEYKNEMRPELGFLEENFEEVPPETGCSITCPDLRKIYELWCKNTGRKAKNDTNLGKSVRKMFPTLKRERGRTQGKFTRFYLGVGLKTESSYYLNDTIYS